MTLGEGGQRIHDVGGGNVLSDLGGGENLPDQGENLPPDLGGGENLPDQGENLPDQGRNIPISLGGGGNLPPSGGGSGGGGGSTSNTNCKTALLTCSVLVGGVEAALNAGQPSDKFVKDFQSGQILSTFATCMNQRQFAACPIGGAFQLALIAQNAARANLEGGGLIVGRPDKLPISHTTNTTQAQTQTQTQNQVYNPQSAQVQVQSATPSPSATPQATPQTTITRSKKFENETQNCAKYLAQCTGKNKGFVQSVLKSTTGNITNLENSLTGALNTCLLANSSPCLIIGAVDKVYQQ